MEGRHPNCQPVYGLGTNGAGEYNSRPVEQPNPIKRSLTKARRQAEEKLEDIHLTEATKYDLEQIFDDLEIPEDPE